MPDSFTEYTVSLRKPGRPTFINGVLTVHGTTEKPPPAVNGVDSPFLTDVTQDHDEPEDEESKTAPLTFKLALQFELTAAPIDVCRGIPA